MLWRCWLGGRKGIRPVKKLEWWGAGVVICLERHADLHIAQLMPLPPTVSGFSIIQIGFTFLVPAHPDSPGKRAVKRVCVCVKLANSPLLSEHKHTVLYRIILSLLWCWLAGQWWQLPDHFGFVFSYFVLIGSVFQYRATRLAGKNISKMTYFVSSRMENLTQLSFYTSIWELRCVLMPLRSGMDRDGDMNSCGFVCRYDFTFSSRGMFALAWGRQQCVHIDPGALPVLESGRHEYVWHGKYRCLECVLMHTCGLQEDDDNVYTSIQELRDEADELQATMAECERCGDTMQLQQLQQQLQLKQTELLEKNEQRHLAR